MYGVLLVEVCLLLVCKYWRYWVCLLVLVGIYKSSIVVILWFGESGGDFELSFVGGRFRWCYVGLKDGVDFLCEFWGI